MPYPAVSVVIPAYRAAATIRRAVDSVLAQSVGPQEIIVVDDGSPDNLSDIVGHYPPPVKLIRIQNARTAAARNVGIDFAQGAFIAFLDADDYWQPNKLEKQLAIFHRHPEIGIVGGRFYLQDLDGSRRVSVGQQQWYDRVLTVTGAKAFLLGTMFWTGTVMIRREVLLNERFVSGLEPAEDRDLWVRLTSRGPAYLLAEPLATAVLESDGISRRSIAVDCQKMLEVVDRHRSLLSASDRRRWQAYVHYRWAVGESTPHKGLLLMLSSFAKWPLPLRGFPAMQSYGRLRRSLTLLSACLVNDPLSMKRQLCAAAVQTQEKLT